MSRLRRRGLAALPEKKRRFEVRARTLGVRAGVNYSKTGEMLDWLDEHG